MSVAASVSRSFSAWSRMPPSTWTAPRVDTARDTTPSAAESSAFEQLMRKRSVGRHVCSHYLKNKIVEVVGV